ncbi:MAG TPA: Bax inhibitor-1 family protein [Kofleriaceae bacterium]|nr:Bax inhibitor-1 family protein [Kofleriaceae bacterium]
MTQDNKKTVLGWLPTTEAKTTGQPPQDDRGQGAPAAAAQPQYAPTQLAMQQPPAHVHTPPPAQAYGQPHGSQQAQPYGSQQAYGSPHVQPYGQPHGSQQPYGAPQPYGQQPYGSQQPYGQAYGTPHVQPYSQGSHAPYPPAQPYMNNYAPQPLPLPAPSQQAAASDATPAAKGRPIDGANATQGVSDRVRFIRMTYLHLLGAILAFAGLLWLLMNNSFLVSKVSVPLVQFALGGRWNWGVVLLVFMVVSWVADYWASHTTSKALQYLGLFFYVVVEALIFVPLLAIVAWKTAAIVAKGGGDPNIIRDSAYVTLGIFAALTASVFITKKDFSFMRSGLMMASGAAVMLVVLSLVFGFNLGLAFSVGMVLLAAAYILYQTSQVLAHYDPNQHVAAALALFSSVALMFWYVIRIFMRMRE